MRFAFTSFSTPQLTLSRMLAVAKELGYDGVEPRADNKHQHGVELATTAAQRKSLRRQVADSGIGLACISTSCKYSDPTKVSPQLEQTRRYIDLAADLGCERIRVFGGEIPEGVPRDRATRSLLECFANLGDYARARHVTVCMETHDSWCDAAIVAFIMRELNHPAIAVNWDIMHTLRQGKASMDEAYRTIKPWVKHVHVHDGLNRLDILRIVPIGMGDFDHHAVLRLLRNDSYDGYVSGEWIESLMPPEFFRTHLATELATLRKFLNNGAKSR